MAKANSTVTNSDIHAGYEISRLSSIHHVFKRDRDVAFVGDKMVFNGTEEERTALLQYAHDGIDGIASGISTIGHILAYSKHDELGNSIDELGWLLVGLGHLCSQLVESASDFESATAIK